MVAQESTAKAIDASLNRSATHDWIRIARDLGRGFAERAEAHDAGDMFVARNYAEMREAKLFSAAVPTELGGGGASYETTCAVIREIAHACGSTALAFSMHSHLLAASVWRYRHNGVPSAEPLLRRIATEELVLVSSGGSDWLDGSGTLEKVAGGFRFNGRKIFGSGSPAGDLLITTGVYDDPVDGPVVLHFGVSLKTDGVSILDNWRAMGMRGTGSNDIVIEDLFVPEGGISARRPKGVWSPLLDVISPIVWPLVMSGYVGVAEAARDIAAAHVARRANDATVQSLVGEMDTELNTARILLDDMVRLGGSDFGPNPDTSNRVYMTKTAVARAVLNTVETAMEAASGAAFYRDLGLERRFRDIQGVRYHPWQEKKQEIFSGRLALGLPAVPSPEQRV